MKYVVGVSEMTVAKNPEHTIITHSLGSCIGVTIYDARACVGGLLHYMLPLSNGNPERARENPMIYADTGIPLLFKKAYRLGANKKDIVVKLAGGSNILDKNDFFCIGQRNYVVARKLFWKNNILIAAEDVGGSLARTLRIELATGKTWVKTVKGEYEL